MSFVNFCQFSGIRFSAKKMVLMEKHLPSTGGKETWQLLIEIIVFSTSTGIDNKLGGGVQCFLFSPLSAEDSHFD